MLVAIHAVDYTAVGLSEFGHPDGYVERQVRRWGEQWERSKTRELPAIDELARRLRAALPDVAGADDRARRLPPRQHDARADDLGRVVAVLDWEMATLGDPLADVGLFLLYWGRDEGATGRRRRDDLARGGLPHARRGRRALREASGRDVSQLDFYEMLASYKLAIILEGIHARFLMGKTVGEGFDHIGALVEIMVQGALDACSRSSIAALRGN